MEGSTKTKEKPAVQPAEPSLESRVAELEAKNVEFVSAADLERVLGEAAKPLLEEIEAKLAEIREAAAATADVELERAVAWAHAKIGALHNAVQRAIGVTITLPEGPTDPTTGTVTVTGTETADGLAK